MKYISYKLDHPTTIQLPQEPNITGLCEKLKLINPRQTAKLNRQNGIGEYDIYLHFDSGDFSDQHRMMSKCIGMGNILRKEGAAVISTRRCLLGLKSYWGLPLCGTRVALRHFDGSIDFWHTGAALGPYYLACQG